MTITQLITSLEQEAQDTPTTLEEFWGPDNTESTQQQQGELITEPCDWLGIPALIKRLLGR